MTLLVLAYLAGLLTIASPCILSFLPFVLVRADRPFRRGRLPLLAGLLLTFAAVTMLAAVAGGWAVEVNRHGRTAALAVMDVVWIGDFAVSRSGRPHDGAAGVDGIAAG